MQLSFSYILQSALCLIPGATIPESHAGHRGVFGKIRTSGVVALDGGEGEDGEVVTTSVSAVDARTGSCRAIFNSPDFFGFEVANSAGRFRARGAR